MSVPMSGLLLFCVCSASRVSSYVLFFSLSPPFSLRIVSFKPHLLYLVNLSLLLHSHTNVISRQHDTRVRNEALPRSIQRNLENEEATFLKPLELKESRVSESESLAEATAESPATAKANVSLTQAAKQRNSKSKPNWRSKISSNLFENASSTGKMRRGTTAKAGVAPNVGTTDGPRTPSGDRLHKQCGH